MHKGVVILGVCNNKESEVLYLYSRDFQPEAIWGQSEGMMEIIIGGWEWHGVGRQPRSY